MTRLLSLPEVAQTLNCSTRKAWGLVNSGTLAHVRVEGQIRVRPSDLEQYIADRLVPSTADKQKEEAAPSPSSRAAS